MSGNSSQIAEMEISVHRWDDDSYRVEIRCQDTVNRVEFEPSYDEVEFDLVELNESALNNDMVAYGRMLTERLFSEPIRHKFEQMRASLEGRGLQIRFRLFIGPSAPRLNNLRWETLRDPQSGEWLLTNENILFSRYLSSQDFRPVLLRPESALKALVVISNPVGLGLGRNEETGYPDFARLNVEDEVKRVLLSFGNMPITFLGDIDVESLDIPATASIANERATLNNIIKRLRDEYDILFMICHGALLKGGPRLWLEKDDGSIDVVAGNELVARLGDLENRPRLVVLASCQSAGEGDEGRTGDDGALAALGPRLSRAGIPAVVAMQGNVAISTVSEFMSTFFAELRKDGRVDRATALARGAIRRDEESWIPVLFLRLADGRIWYVPGFAAEPEDKFRKWNSLIRSIELKKCTPILGSGLLEPLVGSSRSIARRWAELHRFPMAPQNKEDLPHVAQYLTIEESDFFTRSQLRKELSDEIIRRFDFPETKNDKDEWTLSELVNKAGAILRKRDPAEPHKILASLPFPLYITTNPDGLLVEAMQGRENGLEQTGSKAPRVEYRRWRRQVDWPDSIYESEPDFEPTKENPLVYYLFGSTDIENSVVLSEDNYFDYLFGITRPENPLPAVVRRALSDSALLFLGFNLDDWDFRVLFRSIVDQEGGSRRKQYVHVAVQINPEEGRLIDPERARKYLQERFKGIDIEVSIFWGSVDFFVRELKKEWNARHPREQIN